MNKYRIILLIFSLLIVKSIVFLFIPKGEFVTYQGDIVPGTLKEQGNYYCFDYVDNNGKTIKNMKISMFSVNPFYYIDDLKNNGEVKCAPIMLTREWNISAICIYILFILLLYAWASDEIRPKNEELYSLLAFLGYNQKTISCFRLRQEGCCHDAYFEDFKNHQDFMKRYNFKEKDIFKLHGNKQI